MGNIRKLPEIYEGELMIVAIPSDSKQEIGGGFTFRRNLIKALNGMYDSEVQVIDDVRQADVVLLTSSSMITPETVKMATDLSKKIVLRVDNVPRNSRNRNTGTSRLQRYAELSTAVVYQSNWAKEYLRGFLKKDGQIIYNGVDTSIFKKEGDQYHFGYPVYLYSRFNRDETKRWEEAWFKYQMIHKRYPKSKLMITGNFSPEQVEYNFDFFNGEQVEYLGIIDDPKEMAKIYRSCQFFLATYYNDAYSNTYCEALACGMQLYEPSLTGGTPEILKNNEKGVRSIEDMAKDYLQLFKSL